MPSYRFKVTLAVIAASDLGLDREQYLFVEMSEADFYDDRRRANIVEAVMLANGWSAQHLGQWMECPQVSEVEVECLRTALGCPETTEMRAFYPNKWLSLRFQRIEVGQKVYRYQLGGAGTLVKFALEYEGEVSTMLDDPQPPLFVVPKHPVSGSSEPWIEEIELQPLGGD